MSGDVFAVPVRRGWLVHAPRQGVSALVNRTAVERLCQGGPDDVGGALAELRRIVTSPAAELKPRSGPMRPQFLGLIPTRSCNLRCVYCGFGAEQAPSGRMDYRLAVAAIDWFAEQGLGERPSLEVHFFGGEPTVAMDVVQVAVHRARAVAASCGLNARFEMATNGVVDDRQAEFLGDYIDTVVLSLDGPEEIHDRHRPGGDGRGSFQAAARTALRLSRSAAKLCLRVCVSDQNVRDLPAIAGWLCEVFAPSDVDFEVLQRTPRSDAAGLSPPDPYAFAESCWRARRAVREHGIQAVYAAAMADAPRHSFCPVGNDTVIVAPEGRASGCYLPEDEWRRRGLDLNLGRFEAGGTFNCQPEAVQRLRRLVVNKPRCRRCFGRWTCAGGCHVNNTWPGCSNEYNDFCVQTRILYACLLLEELGCPAEVDALWAEPRAMEALAQFSDDRLRVEGSEEHAEA